MSVAPTFDEVAKARYLLLTTFTKDGRPKPTPIWAAREGDRLLVITKDGSWKVKRIRNTPRVTLAVCGVLGKPKGEPVEAVARVLPSDQTRHVYNAIVKRYWWLLIPGWWFYPHTLVLRGIDKVHIGLELTAA